ncbi:thiamine diphosphokinase [Virgibacillus subterraneus]|uniref:Thiamine diphosphokinase n=1 Tax=Virgibacillus subterraneus TaxID=621109 RepID=A0A1H9HBT4_9BACI|nr:thiamine diphosphokinase [Virgibacillus subterraneus]SEQ59805.1 thiamine diphosphokinase [Virgibacillus subterraneus]
MSYVAIMGNGPTELLPDLSLYMHTVDVWIGADRGALTLAEGKMPLDYAVGDFDSINNIEKNTVQAYANSYEVYPVEKDQTDLEIALTKAYELQPEKIYLFGVTGGRLDHALINIQLLYSIMNRGIQGVIVDIQNQLELTFPGSYEIKQNKRYPNISFIPYTQYVKGLTLNGFYYPLQNQSITWGSTLCISNKLLSNYGTFSYKEGILLIIKSRDAMSDTIPM